MSKERISGDSWIDWFQTLKQSSSESLGIFFTILNDFVECHPDIASYLTVEDLHTILEDENITQK